MTYYWSKDDRKDPTYHWCRNCTVGNNIEAYNLQSGATAPAGRSGCKTCGDLQRSNSCTAGVPTPAR